MQCEQWTKESLEGLKYGEARSILEGDGFSFLDQRAGDGKHLIRYTKMDQVVTLDLKPGWCRLRNVRVLEAIVSDKAIASDN